MSHSDSSTDHRQQLISFLPDRIWYLTTNGQDMWCRRPYTFFFSSSSAAEAFGHAMAKDLPLLAVGIDTKELLSEQGLEAMRAQDVTRIFLDPSIDPASGDVFGNILRLEEVN